MTTDKNRIQAYIDDGLLERLKAYAASHRLSVSHAIERLLIESDSLKNLPSVLPESDSLKNLPSVLPESDSPRTYQAALTQIREWAMYNVYHQKRHERITYTEMAKTLRLDGYPPPESKKEWTPEIVSAIVERKGRL